MEQGYEVTFIRFSRLSNSDLSQAALITATNYPSLNRHTVNDLLTAGQNILMQFNAGGPLSTGWASGSTLSYRQIEVEQDHIFLDGYKSNIPVELQPNYQTAYSISSDYPIGWTQIARNGISANHKTVLYRENTTSGGKALIFTYNPASFEPVAHNFADLIYEWFEGTPPHSGVTVPEGNVAFIIKNYDDGANPDLTTTENALYALLFNMNYDISFIRYSRLNNSDFSNAEFIVAVEYPALNRHFINEQLSNGKNIIMYYSAAGSLSDGWSSGSTSSYRNLNVENNSDFLSIYEQDETILMQSSGTAYSISSAYPSQWNVLGHNNIVSHKTAFSKTGNNSRGAIFTYNPATFTDTGNEILEDIINFFNQPFDDVFYTVTFSVEDSHGNSITDATVSLDDHTNEPGIYVFEDIVPGTYSYSISNQCHATYTGEITVTSSNLTENVIMSDLPGDANGDADVDVLDLIAIVSHFLIEEPEPFCFINADVNQDEAINVLDYIGTVNIFLDGAKFFAHTLSGETATIILKKEGIWLRSNGNVTGIQFELTGDHIAQLQLNPDLASHQFVSNIHNGKLIGAFVSINNTPIPAGDIQLISFAGNDELFSWGDVVAGDTNAGEIVIEKTTEEATHASHLVVMKEFIVYPNPAQSWLMVQTSNSSAETLYITLTDIQGRILQTHTITEQGYKELKINLQGLRSGIYILLAEHEKGFYRERVIVK